MKNLEIMLLRFWNWLKISSADSMKISLTLKSAGPFILFLAAFLKLDIGMGDWDKLIEAVVAVISGFYFIFGFSRKIVLSFRKYFKV